MRHLKTETSAKDIKFAHDFFAAGSQLNGLFLDLNRREATAGDCAKALIDLSETVFGIDCADDSHNYIIWDISGMVIGAQLISGHFFVKRTMANHWLAIRVALIGRSKERLAKLAIRII